MTKEGQNNSGASSSANILRWAAVGVAALQTAVAIKIATLQEKIARGYLYIAQDERSYYYSTFYPVEDEEISEACSEEIKVENPEIIVGRMQLAARVASAAAIATVIATADKYNTGNTEVRLVDALASEANAVAISGNRAYRYEEEFIRALNEIRWARRESALNRGRGLASAAVSFTSFSSGIFNGLLEETFTGLAGSLYYIGHEGVRNSKTANTNSTIKDVSEPTDEYKFFSAVSGQSKGV